MSSHPGPHPSEHVDREPSQGSERRQRRPDVGPRPYVIVLFGASGDLARRKLLPGLLHLSLAGLVPDCRIIGTSLDDLDDEAVPQVRPQPPATSSPAAR